MADRPPQASLGWMDGSLPIGSHVCFYYSDEQALRDSLSFIRVGLDNPDDFAVIFADESRFGELVSWLAEGYAGDVGQLIEQGKLALIPGAPTLDELVSNIGARLDAAVHAGYRLIRFLGFIAWGKAGWPDEPGLLAFEARVNEVVTAYPAVIICTYGVPALPGTSLIYGGLRTHPITILGEDIVRNPHYVGPAASRLRGSGS